MRAQKVAPKRFEFYFPDLDNLILVENLEDGGVIIRATRDVFSQQRKAFFIRQLAAEGFIPDSYQWWSGSATGVTWVIDITWLKLPRVWLRRSKKFMVRLLVFSGVLWLALMRVLCVSQPAYSHGANPANPKPAHSATHLLPARR